jgi:hypothetical protein
VLWGFSFFQIPAGEVVLTLPRRLRVGGALARSYMRGLPAHPPDLSALTLLLTAWLPSAAPSLSPTTAAAAASGNFGGGGGGGGEGGSEARGGGGGEVLESFWRLFVRCLPATSGVRNGVVMGPAEAAAWASIPDQGQG